MKALLFTLALTVFGLSGHSQDDRNWTLYKSIDGVEVYTQEVDCAAENIPSQKGILVKVVNTNAYTCTIEWDLSVWYNNEKLEQNIKDGENHHTIQLDANKEIQGNCDTPYGALYIFKDFITYVSPTKLTNFELEGIRVTKI